MTRFSEFALAAARLATGRLGWTPDQFWAATVCDLVLALEGRFGGQIPAAVRADLERLMREFPDG
ncbi:phage tail assembly chaperone [Thermaurantiacus tibetensis]|uniref:phage tail assembly chaperone n=1 Tax=Thermaurantiacus tibetensis TaxID=2759035 RepID=UPI0018906235|nr:phage tail assembly chaperone [Thermaurantiacus tibetensis]